MAIIKVKRIQQENKDKDIVFKNMALFCLHYPQYKLDEAEQLPYHKMIKMLKLAYVREAERYYNLVQIFGNASSQKGYKKLLNHYKGVIDE